MVRRTILSILLSLLVTPQLSAAPGHVVWGPVDGDPQTHVVASGDPADDRGADLSVSTAAVGGAITALDPPGLRGREAELCARLSIVSGTGKAMLWLRADTGLAFVNGAREMVGAGDGEQRRCLRLYVPAATSLVSFGVVSDGPGVVQARGLRLRALPQQPLGGATEKPTRAVLEAMLDATQAHALHSGRIDWPTLRSRLLTDDLATLPVAEAYARFREVTRALGDRHSFALPPQATSDYRRDATPTAPVRTWVRDGVGYVAVPGVRGSDNIAGERFARQLCDTLAGLRAQATRGWIVDLRKNSGGNMWPMLSGLSPLLGTDRPGSFRYADGRQVAWRVPRPTGCRWSTPDTRIAVLIGPETASSGEAAAIAFRGAPGHRFFGAPTAGVSTSNESFPLPDGGTVWITTSIDVDRGGTAYPAGVQPDEPSAPGDPGVDAALRWVTSRSR